MGTLSVTRSALIVALCGVGAALAQPPPTRSAVPYASGAANPLAAQVKAYPNVLLSGRSLAGVVEVEGSITPEREFADPMFRATEGMAIELEPAARELVAEWRFSATKDAECMPVTSRAIVRIRFEPRDGGSLVHLTRIDPPSPVPSQGAIDLKPLERTPVTYPRGFSREQAWSLVYAGLQVRPNGTVKQITTKQFTNASKPESFIQATVKGLQGWKFTPLEDSVEMRMVCFELAYHLSTATNTPKALVE